ncbi:MAG TPA: ABC transporter permease [Balneolaceae bacterium]|nr:ABC transporter permease [Balneolaceae bacterium]
MIDLQKLLIIIQREYLTRIRKKAFIIITLLVPVGIVAMIAIPIILQQMKSGKTFKVAIKDQTHAVAPKMTKMNAKRYINAGSTPVAQLRREVKNKKIDGYIVITPKDIRHAKAFQMIYNGDGGISFVSKVQNDLQTAVRQTRLKQAGASDQILSILKNKPALITRKLTASGEEQASNTLFLFAIGYVMAFIIYLAILGYGGYVMRSVIEEKTNRIYEVVISSAKPTELLLGKILGIGALGVTQFIIWVVVGAVALIFSGPVLTNFVSPQTAAVIHQLPAIVGLKVGIYFIAFFILGFFLYGSILAAVGSAVDSSSDTQQMMLPVMIPVILSIIMLSRVASAPDSGFAVITSIIPFFSPVLMIARIPITQVPGWQIALSIILMILSVLASLYIGAKIYRVGILSYGKSAGYRELWKWIKR